MKWFKHISDSLDDPFVFELLDTFGADGYLVFFGVLEIYSREFKTELNWNLCVTRAYLKQKLHKRQDTLIIKVLEHIKNSGKWIVEYNDSQVDIFIPKFTELLDDWSQRKLRSNSVVTPKILKTNKIKEEEADKDINNKAHEPFRLPSKELIENGSTNTILQNIEIVSKEIYDKKIWPDVYSFKNKMLKNNCNQRAVLHTLSRLLISRPADCWAYCVKVMKQEDGNFNARDYEKNKR